MDTNFVLTDNVITLRGKQVEVTRVVLTAKSVLDITVSQRIQIAWNVTPDKGRKPRNYCMHYFVEWPESANEALLPITLNYFNATRSQLNTKEGVTILRCNQDWERSVSAFVNRYRKKESGLRAAQNYLLQRVKNAYQA